MSEDLDQTFSRDGKVISTVKRKLTREELELRSALTTLQSLRQKALSEWTPEDLKKAVWSLIVVLRV
jgi:hypothetical protein